MVPDDESSDEEEGQSDSDSLGLEDDLGEIKVEVNEEKQIDSNDDDDFYEDQTVKNQIGQDNQSKNTDEEEEKALTLPPLGVEKLSKEMSDFKSRMTISLTE